MDQENPQNAAPEVITQETAIAKEEFMKVKADMHRFKEEAKAAKELLENQKLEAMKAKQDWEGIAKRKEEEADEYRSKYEGLSKSLVNNAKHSAIKTAALKAGILDSALGDLELLDFAEVSVETTSTGKILVTGAEMAIEDFKKRRPHWFRNQAPGINPQSPETHTPSTNKVTLEEVNKAQQLYVKNPQNRDALKAYEMALYAFKTQNPS